MFMDYGFNRPQLSSSHVSQRSKSSSFNPSQRYSALELFVGFDADEVAYLELNVLGFVRKAFV